MPRWNFDKFKGADDTLGFQMKSVGEVMAIGRTFPEALQKACQSLENNATGLSFISTSRLRPEEILESLKRPQWDRIFRIKEAIAAGISIKTIRELTQIDRWFLYQIQDIVALEKRIAASKHLDLFTEDLMWEAKQMGFSDEQIAELLRDCTADEVYDVRKKMGVTRVFKMVDTCSAEFEAKTPYFYSTFERPATA
jgi:carbamoyl-phosphate synthase large subunit